MKYTLLLVAFCMFHNLSSAQVKEEKKTAVMVEQIPVVKFEQDGLYSLKHHSTGTVILPAIYLSVKDESSNGRFILTQRDQRKGLYHGWSGKMIIPVEFDDIQIHDSWSYEDYISHGRNDTTFLAMVRKNNREGVYFFGKQGRNIPAEYDDISQALPTDYFIGTKNNRYSLFDGKGNPVVSDQKGIAVFENGNSMLIQITNDQGKQGLYDSRVARFILPVQYDRIGSSYSELFIVKQMGRYGMVNSTGKEAVPFHYDTLAFLNSYLATTRLKAAQKHRYGLLTFKNKVLTKFEYNDIESNGSVYTVKLDEGYSIIDSAGSRITTVYDHIGVFYQDTCTVALKNKSGYIRTNGTVISIDKPRKEYGFTTLNDLYNGLVKALKADNDTALMAFCQQVIFDEGTCEFMKRRNFSYRGVPHQIGDGKNSIKAAVESYAEYVRRFQEQLRRNNELRSLRFVSTEDNYDRKPMGTESMGTLSTDKRTYMFTIGELILLNNYWKSFTFPKWIW